MNLDLAIIAISVVLGFFGAMSGASGQVANWVSLPLAWIASRAWTAEAAPHLARAVGLTPWQAEVAARVGIFFVVLLLLRAVISSLVRRLLGGGDGERRGLDRLLGFALGSGRSLLIAWVALSALAFAADHVRVSGKPVAALQPPADSRCYAFAREYNAFGDGKDFKMPAVPSLPAGAAGGLPSSEAAGALLKRGMENMDRRSATRQIERALEGGER